MRGAGCLLLALLAVAVGCGDQQRQSTVPDGRKAPAAAPTTDAAPPPPPATGAPAVTCMSDERQFGTSCCRAQPRPSRTSLTCRGPQIGQACRKKSDCDIICRCDDALVHKDGLTGVTGTCGGTLLAGQWMCELDAKGAVSSLIID